MINLTIAIGAYSLYLIYHQFFFSQYYQMFMLSWAGAGALMSIFYRPSPISIIFASTFSLIMSLLFNFKPLTPWAMGMGVATGIMTPYLIETIKINRSMNRAVGYGIGMALIVLTIMVYLKPHVPEEYFQMFISILPFFYFFIIPLLSLSPEKGEGWKERLYYHWDYGGILLFTLGLITGIYYRSIFPELLFSGWFHDLILFLSASAASFFMAQWIGEKGLKLHHSLFFIFSIPLSLAVFGFSASTLSYMLSDLFVGLGLGGAAVFAFFLISDHTPIHRAVCLGLIGLGLVFGGRFARLLQKLYEVDMEGIAFISIFLFFAGTIPALLMSGGKRTIEEAEGPEGKTLSKKEEVMLDEEVEAPLFNHPPDVTKEKAAFHHLCREFNLSPREEEVLSFIFEGKRAKEIAGALFITDSTVKTHIKHIYEKLGVTNRAELIKKIKP